MFQQYFSLISVYTCTLEHAAGPTALNRDSYILMQQNSVQTYSFGVKFWSRQNDWSILCVPLPCFVLLWQSSVGKKSCWLSQPCCLERVPFCVKRFHFVLWGFHSGLRGFHLAIGGFHFLWGFHTGLKGFHFVLRWLHTVIQGFLSVLRWFNCLNRVSLYLKMVSLWLKRFS